MKKRLTAAVLALALCLGLYPAFGAGAEEKFPAVNQYPGYADVAESDWFYANAKLCYETGLMNGTDLGFEPNKVLSQAEAVTLAARVGATLRGENIPALQPGDPWWGPYYRYLFPFGGGPNYPEGNAARSQFLSVLYNCVEPLLTPINDVKKLPEPDLGNIVTILKYYNAGILTGVDKYGTFAGNKPLTRAEAAAMVSRVIRPELRLSFTPANYSPFTAAYLTPDTVMFDTGLTAEEYLITVNNAIAAWEAALGEDFNWHYVWTDGKSVLSHVKDDSLSALGVTAKQGTQAYKDFDVQVYYSRLIDLTGGPLGQTGAPKAAREAPQAYTLTEIALPEGWSPAGSSYSVADKWTPVQRIENERVAETAIYRSDGTLFTDVLEGGSPYTGEGPASAGNTWYACLRKEVREPGSIDFDDRYALFDVKEGKLVVPYQPYGTYRQSAAAIRGQNDRPWPTQDEATGLYGYRDEAGNWLIPARYYEMFYLGDGVFTYWGEGNDCGLVSMDGVETPTGAFRNYFNGGLTANYGLIATTIYGSETYDDAYFDYAGNQVSEAFDWAGPIGDDGAGFVCKDGKLYRIQF